MLVTGGGGVGKEGHTWVDPAAKAKGVGVDAGNSLASPPSNGGAASPSGSGNGRSMAGAVGVATTCFACNVPRVSRRVTCQGCDETFHWSCIGFYEHKYQRPGDNWRCKGCKGVEPPPPLSAAAGAAGTSGPPMMRAPQSGEAIDVGLDPPPSTTPPATLPLAALVRAETPDASVVVTTAAVAVPAAAVAAAVAAAASAAAAVASAAATVVPAVQAAPAAPASVAVPSSAAVPAVPAVVAAPAAAVAPAVAAPAVAATAPAATFMAPASVESARKVQEVNLPLPLPVAALQAGEPVCPVCRKFIGRKRTMDCSVCRMPSHAGCVNVRGAETPIHWVCRDCRSGVEERVEVGVGREVAGASSTAGAGVGVDTARVSDAPTFIYVVDTSVHNMYLQDF